VKIAVITPCYRVPPAWLSQCLESVAAQSVPCTHFVVFDGDDPFTSSSDDRLQVIRLAGPHRDSGNAARAIGSVSAICQGFDALTYLDADNWLEPHHIEGLLELHERTGAMVCSTGRNLYEADGSFLGWCPEVDGEQFADINCLFLTWRTFELVPLWFWMPRRLVHIRAQVMWNKIKQRGFTRSHRSQATVNCRTMHRHHYEYFGKPAPAGSKHVVTLQGPNGTIAYVDGPNDVRLDDVPRESSHFFKAENY
jgi:glycosyltransferase involved in cell wall biosynthesis